MATLIGKFVVSVVDPEMLLIAYINQAVIATSSIGMDDTFDADSTSDDRLKPGTEAIRDDLGIDFLALEDAKDNGFTDCATAHIPLTRQCPKLLSSTSISPRNRACRSQYSAIRWRKAVRYLHGISVQATH